MSLTRNNNTVIVSNRVSGAVGLVLVLPEAFTDPKDDFPVSKLLVNTVCPICSVLRVECIRSSCMLTC